MPAMAAQRAESQAQNIRAVLAPAIAGLMLHLYAVDGAMRRRWTPDCLRLGPRGCWPYPLPSAGQPQPAWAYRYSACWGCQRLLPAGAHDEYFERRRPCSQQPGYTGVHQSFRSGRPASGGAALVQRGIPRPGKAAARIKGLSTAVGDEGGFALRSCQRRGGAGADLGCHPAGRLPPRRGFMLGMDAAASGSGGTRSRAVGSYRPPKSARCTPPTSSLPIGRRWRGVTYVVAGGWIG